MVELKSFLFSEKDQVKVSERLVVCVGDELTQEEKGYEVETLLAKSAIKESHEVPSNGPA